MGPPVLISGPSVGGDFAESELTISLACGNFKFMSFKNAGFGGDDVR